MKYAMIVDTTRCSYCFACQVACKDEFVGNVYPPYSYSQPDKDQEWIRVTEAEKGKHPWVKVYLTPVLCMHCDKAPCIDACPVPNGIYKMENGVVIIDPVLCYPAKCDNKKPCIEKCPYKVIFYNENHNICQKCTLCAHRLDEGKPPACIDACPSSVFIFGEESEIVKEAKKRGAKWMNPFTESPFRVNPEYGAEPRIYYIGLPSVSLAGHLIDSKSLMDVPGATITVLDRKTNKAVLRKSNISGNFVTPDLKLNGTYSVKIERQGYLQKNIDSVVIDNEYKHLGDMKLVKAT